MSRNLVARWCLRIGLVAVILANSPWSFAQRAPSLPESFPPSNPSSATAADSTEMFELVARGLDSPSIATVSAESLSIASPDGAVSEYKRLRRYDTPDGSFVGYSSRELKQIIRWPVSKSGNMEIGVLRDGKIEFSKSHMTVRMLASQVDSDAEENLSLREMPALPRKPPTAQPAPMESFDRANSAPLNLTQPSPFHFGVGAEKRQFLSMGTQNNFQLITTPKDLTSTWYLNPVGKDLVRLQQRVGDQWNAISVGARGAAPRDRQVRGGGVGSPRIGQRQNFPLVMPPNALGGGGVPLQMNPIHGGIDQLWRIQSYRGGGYVFESLLYPGMCLTFPPSGGLFLQPIVWDPWQIWYPQVPTFQLPVPQYETREQQFIPNPDLPRIEIELLNTHQDELLVLFADRRRSNTPTRLRIPKGEAARIQIERDSGGTVIENVAVYDLLGNWNQQQYTTPVPPTVLYDLSVYEVRLQYIAIDRTGTSPNPIEDMNFQPRSVGFFLLPPGAELEDGYSLDVYRVASEAGNPGGVRRLTEKELRGDTKPPTKDPLKDILNQFQKQRAAF